MSAARDKAMGLLEKHGYVALMGAGHTTIFVKSDAFVEVNGAYDDERVLFELERYFKEKEQADESEN